MKRKIISLATILVILSTFTSPVMAQAGNEPIGETDTSLVSPDYLTQELSIMLSVIFVTMLYGSLKLRSMFGIFGWMLMTVVLMMTFFTEIQFIWFWLMVIIESFILVLAAVEYTRAAARGKN